MFSIYKYTNIHNGKVYIGQTSLSLSERAQSNGSNYLECRRFYNAIKKYSWSAFVPEVITEVATQDEANRMEQYYISLYNSTNPDFGYNISAGGGCHAMTDESKKIISEKAKERYKDKTANPMYGKHHSSNTIERMYNIKLGSNNPMFGRSWTETQKQKCGTKGKKLNLSEEQRKKLSVNAYKLGKTTGLKAVECIEDRQSFKSVTAAAEAYGVTKATLNDHLKGRQKTCAGKHFKYIDVRCND